LSIYPFVPYRSNFRHVKPILRHQEGAASPATQQFHYISGDLITASESVRIISEATEFNKNAPPDIVWCCAGSSYPTLFIDTPVGELKNQMDSNYFTSAYMAHAILRAWLKGPSKITSSSNASDSDPLLPRHLIFTASFLSFFTLAGYGPYSPTKVALRSLSDTLSQEMNLYSSSPDRPKIRLHTIFPATIFTESYNLENRVKSDLTKKLEEGDPGQTPDEVAKRSIAGLERGDEMVTTTLLTRLVMTSTLGGSIRNGWAILDTVLSWVMSLVMVAVRWDMDVKVRRWARENGDSGKKRGPP
jgi:3-dehydrosphinganine reductase